MRTLVTFLVFVFALGLAVLAARRKQETLGAVSVAFSLLPLCYDAWLMASRH